MEMDPTPSFGTSDFCRWRFNQADKRAVELPFPFPFPFPIDQSHSHAMQLGYAFLIQMGRTRTILQISVHALPYLLYHLHFFYFFSCLSIKPCQFLNPQFLFLHCHMPHTFITFPEEKCVVFYYICVVFLWRQIKKDRNVWT